MRSATAARLTSSQYLRLLRQKGFVIGAALVSFIVILAIMAPVLASFDPLEQDLPVSLRPPGVTYYFGTDEVGRDLFSRVLYGARVSLLVGVVSVLIGAGIGTLVGILAGFWGGWVDQTLSRVIDTLLAFPMLLMALTVIAILGSDLKNVMVAIGISNTPDFARVIRGMVLSIKRRDFIEGARAAGSGPVRIMARHIFPNCLSLLIVIGTLRIGAAILTESNLSFLGLGVQPPTPSWGSIISMGREFIQEAPWIGFIPGFGILLAVMGFNLLGEGLRDFLDPRLR